jgi:hypothetical protein
MEKIVLKQGIVDKLLNDPIYFGKMAQHLGVKPVTLPRILYANHERLTQAGTLRFLSKLFKIQEKDLLETVKETVVQN